MSLYVNGKPAGLVVLPSPAHLPKSTIGIDEPGRCMDGWLHSARVWRRALSAGEIKRDMLMRFSSTTRPLELVGAFDFKEGTGCFVADEDGRWSGSISGAVRWEECDDDDVVTRWHTVRGSP